jgi:hypothetical protein
MGKETGLQKDNRKNGEHLEFGDAHEAAPATRRRRRSRVGIDPSKFPAAAQARRDRGAEGASRQVAVQFAHLTPTQKDLLEDYIGSPDTEVVESGWIRG